MLGLILYWTVSSLAKKNNLVSKEEVKETNKKLNKSVRWLNIKIIIKNNSNIKPTILRLFYCSLIINMLVLGIVGAAVVLYTGVFFYNFLNCKIADINQVDLPWIGILIINILYILFIVKTFSDYYKLSLRGTYRNNYQKLLFLDIFTLNIFSIIGTIVFIKNKEQMLKIHKDFKDFKINNNLTAKVVKDYFQIISRIEIFIFLLTLLIFTIALISGYYIQNNTIKVICLVFITWCLIVLYSWSGYRIIGGIIIRKMLKNLISNNSYYYLLSTIRFLPFILGSNYSAILINILIFDESLKEKILGNW